jgi:malonate transporter MadL subunit
MFGTALLAVCYLLGIVAGEALGTLIGVKANVGGVGFAMILLIASLHVVHERGAMTAGTERGVTFWAALYIPVVVAMSATQNVLVAFKSGIVAVLWRCRIGRRVRVHDRRDQPRHRTARCRSGMAERGGLGLSPTEAGPMELLYKAVADNGLVAAFAVVGILLWISGVSHVTSFGAHPGIGDCHPGRSGPRISRAVRSPEKPRDSAT